MSQRSCLCKGRALSRTRLAASPPVLAMNLGEYRLRGSSPISRFEVKAPQRMIEPQLEQQWREEPHELARLIVGPPKIFSIVSSKLAGLNCCSTNSNAILPSRSFSSIGSPQIMCWNILQPHLPHSRGELASGMPTISSAASNSTSPSA